MPESAGSLLALVDGQLLRATKALLENPYAQPISELNAGEAFFGEYWEKLPELGAALCSRDRQRDAG
jgi:hypothetical protein